MSKDVEQNTFLVKHADEQISLLIGGSFLNITYNPITPALFYT